MAVVSITCPSHLCAALRPLQMVKMRMGQLSYLQEERLFYSTGQVSVWGTPIPVLSDAELSLSVICPEPSELWCCERDSLGKESLETGPCQTSRFPFWKWMEKFMVIHVHWSPDKTKQRHSMTNDLPSCRQSILWVYDVWFLFMQ